MPMVGLPAEKYDKENVASALSYLNLRTIPWSQQRFFEKSPNKGGHLLEIGCSTGEFLKTAQEAGYSVTGIDSAPETAGFAQSHFGLTNIFPLTIQEFIAQKPKEKFDVIVFFQVLEHIDNLPDFIDSIKKLLLPGGFIAVSVPNRDRWRIRSERFFTENWDLPPCHLTRWNIKALENLFKKSGFSVISAEAEPLRLYDHGWSNFVSQKLGINRLAEVFARKTVGKPQNTSVTTRKFNIRQTMAGYLGIIYKKGFFPLLGIITLPFRLVLRRQGTTLYLLVTNGNQKEG